MLRYQTLIVLFWCIAANSPIPIVAQSSSNTLNFHTSQGNSIAVKNGSIFLNRKELYRMKYDDIKYASKRNRIIEDSGSTFLFLEINGNPNLDRLYAFQLTAGKAELVADAISSDLKDFDGDSYLEFGGADLTEKHPSEDSMYYVPFMYYKIRNGKILFDSAFSKKMDIQVNGVYLAHPLDPRVGGCCRVIVRPGLKKISLVDPLIISERIDGPANIRDAVKGRQMFMLNDNIPVSTSETVEGWYGIGLAVDLTDSQFVAQKIAKGGALYVSGVAVGKALDDLSADPVFKENGRCKGVLTGYTMARNIKESTLPENVLAKMIDRDADENIGMARLNDFIRGFGLSEEHIGSYVTYQLDEGAVSSYSSPLRILLVFNKDELFAVVHQRKLPLKDSSVYNLKRGYSLSVISSPSPAYTDKFIKDFNEWVSKAD